MASAVKGQMILSSGMTARIVDAGVGVTPRYAIEYLDGQDAMGISRWALKTGFGLQDVIDILKATGYLQ